MVKWVCRHCCFKNDMRLTQCSNCSRANDGTWTCRKCSFGYTSLHNSECDQCGAKYEELNFLPIHQRNNNLQSAANGHPPAVTPQFGGLRGASNQFTSHPQPGPSLGHSVPIPGPRQWSCPRCTLLNDLSTVVCDACRLRRTIDVVDSTIQPDAVKIPVRQCNICLRAIKPEDGKDFCAQCLATTTKREEQRNFERSISHIEQKREEDVETKAQELYTNIMSVYTKMNGEFVDDSFRPEMSSLFFNPGSLEARSSNVTRWLRPSMISNKQWSVCASPSSDDIQQGVLGNCWLMSALAVIADRQELIDKLIVHKEYNRFGVYQVRLCKEGQWYIVTIDDLFPCNDAGHLVYSKAARHQLWVALIEKAAAKVFGCYEALCTGYCVEGLSLLTGAPCETLVLQPSNNNFLCEFVRPEDDMDYDIIWAKLLSAKDANFIFSASCGGGTMQPDDRLFKSVGLSSRHAYSILDIVEIVDKNQKSHRLLKLMNPWSSRQNCWNGDWSPRSPSWNVIPAAIRDNLCPSDGQSSRGVFWIEFSDMIKFFYCIDICRLRPNYHERRIHCDLPQPQRVGDDRKVNQTVVIHVTETTEAEFVFYQEKSRNEDSLKKDIFFIVLEGDATRVKAGQSFGRVITHAKRTLNFSTTCYAVLQPGTYTIVWFSFWNWGPQLCTDKVSGNLAIFTARKIHVQQNYVDATFIPEVLMHFVVSTGVCQPNSSNAFYLTGQWVGMLLVVQNSARVPLCVISDCNNSTNMQCTRSPLDNLVVRDTIPPGYRQIITVLTQVDAYSPYTFHHKMEYQYDLNARIDHQPSLILALHEPRPLPYR